MIHYTEFQTFTEISQSAHVPLQGAALVFGSSLYSPKETVLFDLSKSSFNFHLPASSSSSTIPGAFQQQQEFMVPLTRSFYKYAFSPLSCILQVAASDYFSRRIISKLNNNCFHTIFQSNHHVRCIRRAHIQKPSSHTSSHGHIYE
jgi:hypothetical protein